MPSEKVETTTYGARLKELTDRLREVNAEIVIVQNEYDGYVENMKPLKEELCLLRKLESNDEVKCQIKTASMAVTKCKEEKDTTRKRLSTLHYEAEIILKEISAIRIHMDSPEYEKKKFDAINSLKAKGQNVKSKVMEEIGTNRNKLSQCKAIIEYDDALEQAYYKVVMSFLGKPGTYIIIINENLCVVETTDNLGVPLTAHRSVGY